MGAVPMGWLHYGSTNRTRCSNLGITTMVLEKSIFGYERYLPIHRYIIGKTVLDLGWNGSSNF
jgi:hypothetical protein